MFVLKNMYTRTVHVYKTMHSCIVQLSTTRQSADSAVQLCIYNQI